MADLGALTLAIEAGDRATAAQLTGAAIAEGVEPAAVLAAMTRAMDAVGTRFQAGEIFVPEMLIAARAMQHSMTELEPALVAAGVRPEHKAIIGTIEGDLHDIGKDLVAMMWRGANLEVIDLGVNVGADAFAAATAAHRPTIVGISALLTTTMTGMRAALEAVRSVDPRVKVFVGGAPVTPEFAAEIGADGYAPDAGSAAQLARSAVASA